MAPPKPNPNVRSKFSLLQRCLLPTRYQAWLAKDQLLETNPDGMRSGNARQLGKVVMIRNNSAMNAVRHLGPDRIAMPPFKKGNGSERAAEHVFTRPSHNDDPSRFVFFFTMYEIQQTGEPCSNQLAKPVSFLSWMMVEQAAKKAPGFRGPRPKRARAFRSRKHMVCVRPCGPISMVEPVGIEPTTLCLQSRCSPS